MQHEGIVFHHRLTQLRERASVAREAACKSRRAARPSPAENRRGNRIWLPSPHQVCRAALLAAALLFFTGQHTAASADIPKGVWLIDGRAAVQIFDCSGLMCGRILWLKVPRDPQGALDLDKKNPNPALRQRRLCGLTILWNLQPAGPDRWEDGWFYNPDDGKTYRVTAHLSTPATIVARIYLGVPLFGETKTLTRVPQETSEGWC